jgi:hypothetical protein
MWRTILRKLIHWRVARRILAAVLAVIVSELNDADGYSRSSYGSNRHDGGAHSAW